MLLSSSYTRGAWLCMFFTLFSCVHTGSALTIPQAPGTFSVLARATRHASRSIVSHRARDEHLSARGVFNHSLKERSTEGSNGLLPIKEVLQVMLTQPPPSFGAVESTPSPTTTLASAKLATPVTATAFATAPPVLGPGIVLLPSTLLSGFTPTSDASEPTSATITDVDSDLNRNAPSSHSGLIVGSIIGGILCVALILLLVLYPSLSCKSCGFSRLRKLRRNKRDRGISHIAEPEFSNIYGSPGSPDRTMVGVQDQGKSSSPEKVGENTLIEDHSNPIPESKFSICSSDYLSTSVRNSAATATSMSASEAPARPSVVTFASSPRPTRPPRPPTADSPALSDSVYLACERQPYVVAPVRGKERASRVDNQSLPKKMLTPSEFFALYVPGIISSLTGKTEGSRKERVVSEVPVRRSSATGSQHSRTKSAPSLGSGTRRARASKSKPEEGGQEAEVPSDVIVYKVTRHHRSRSASGWAYPDRSRSRRLVHN